MKICVFTGTRAEYGLLQPLINVLRKDDAFQLKLLVSGAHLSPEYGLTVGQIEEVGAMETVEMLLSSDTAVGTAKSFGLGVIGFADALSRFRPEWCIIAGDRSEAFACAATCAMLSIPVAHLHGGELSGGSLDEYYRHAITKLSRLHFTSTAEYAQRVIQMGERPETVHNVGAIGLDNLKLIQYLSRGELETALGIRFLATNLLITYHPGHTESLDDLTQKAHRFLSELDTLHDTLLIFTKANSDANGRAINSLIQEFVDARSDRACVFASLGVQRYFSLMRIVDVVVGNSSSGLLEAPSFGVPTVNVGHRQDGRIRAESVFDSAEEAVGQVVRSVLARPPQKHEGQNPYGDGNAAMKIISVLKTVKLAGNVKKFYDGRPDI